MVKFIDIYAQSFVNTDVQATYSRTARAVNALKAQEFDAILAQENVSYARTPKLPEHKDTHFAETEQIYFRAKSNSGIDPIFNDTAAQRKYQEMQNLFARFDPILAAHRYNLDGEAT